MEKRPKQKLEAAGWVVGDTDQFLGLTDAEADFIHLKLSSAKELKDRRMALEPSQSQVAKMVESSHSRVAKTEGADPSVSADLRIETILKLGASRAEIAEAVSAPLAGGCQGFWG